MNRLKELRIEKKLLQSDIAKIINKGERTVGFYETGDRDMGTETLAILADFFNVSIDYLLGKTDVRNTGEIIDDVLNEAMIGMSKKDYENLTETQKKQIRDFALFVKNQNEEKN
ncbi:MAG: helix-turn-helix transcriptional regulator [Clostridia bacterium]|nr:helix-turn-helix transcriptional regulator [Clostridia bacterium]